MSFLTTRGPAHDAAEPTRRDTAPADECALTLTAFCRDCDRSVLLVGAQACGQETHAASRW